MAFFPAFGQQQQQNNNNNNISNGKPATTLFGQSATGQSTNAFGGFAQNQPQGQQQAPSLFGGQNHPSGTNIFGGSTNAQNTAGNASQPSTGLFGQNQPQQQQQQITNIFGQPASTGLFSSNSQSQPQQQQQQQQQSNIFGNTQTQPGSSAFGGFGASQQNVNQAQQGSGFSLFGQPAQSQFQSQQQQTQGLQFQNQSTAGPVLFTRTTKFNDLPEEVRRKFEQIDAHIQGRVQISTELKQHKLADEPQKGAEHTRNVHKDLVNSINKLRLDLASMRELRARMDQAVQDTIAATRIIDAFRASQGQGQAQAQGPGGQSMSMSTTGQGQSQSVQAQTVWLKNYAEFPLEFFTRVTEQLRERLQWFNSTLEQIERKLASEANHVSVTPQSITTTLQAQHASFVALAAKTAALDGELQKLKHTYRTLWRARTGSARDPFNELDRGSLAGTEFGIEGLSVA